MSATPGRPVSSLAFNDSVRQSPFRRQNSVSPATVWTTTPSQSPTKTAPSLSPTKAASLSPEKTSPFVRRPSQISHAQQASERPASPFARTSSNLSIPTSPSRQVSNASYSDSETSGTPRQTPSRTPSYQSAVAHEEAPMPSTAFTRDAASPSPFDGPAPDIQARPTNLPSQNNLRPTAQRSTTSSTVSTLRAPIFTLPPTQPSIIPTPKLSNAVQGTYNHVPQPLLRSMRESFEVLDSANTGTITSASVSSMLEQMGMDNSSSSLRDFFPPSSPSQLNLARYLDSLSGPMAALSHPEELAAAFEAFDVDDSGQIDVAELRRALLETAPEPGEEVIRLSEREVDSVLGEFASRRAFGAKGVNVAKGKGEVFRYRDFMAGISGGGGADAGVSDGAAVMA